MNTDLSPLGRQQRGERRDEFEIRRGRDIVDAPGLLEVLLAQLPDLLVEHLAHGHDLGAKGKRGKRGLRQHNTLDQVGD